MKKLIEVGAALLLGLVVSAPPAQAAIITANSVTFTSGDLGDSATGDATVAFGGNVNQNNQPGLTSTATFDLLSVTGTTAMFQVTVNNTSTAPITDSRVSGLAFNTSPNLAASGHITTSSLLDNVVLDDALPNQVGVREGCVSAHQSQCGASGDGITPALSPHTFNLTLNFVSALTLTPTGGLTLSDFAVRYQSIAGSSFGTSGTGTGTPGPGGDPPPPPPPPPPVPEPTSLALLGLGLLGAGWARRRRK
jgi:hypothetical protein